MMKVLTRIDTVTMGNIQVVNKCKDLLILVLRERQDMKSKTYLATLNGILRLVAVQL